MCIEYDYFEKLQFNTTESNAEHVATIKDLLEDKLANMLVRILYDSLILHIYVNADGEEYYFSGESLSRYKDIYNAVRRASQLHITFSYWFYCYPSDIGSNVGPEVLKQFFEEAPDELFEDILYAYYEYDYSVCDNRGVLFAYRLKDGLVQKGRIELKEISQLPEPAFWDATTIAILVEDDFPGIDKEKLTQIVDSMKKLNDYEKRDLKERDGVTPYQPVEFSITGDTVYFNIKGMALNTSEEVHQYAALARELYFLLNETEREQGPQNVAVEFYSEANEEPRILSIDVSGEDGYKMYMASLD